MTPPIYTAAPFFEPEDQAYIAAELPKILNGQLSMGPNVAEFESRFAEMCGAKYAIALNACTSALEIALAFLNLKPGDEVILPSQTFIATGMAVHLAGATPVFAEINATSMGLDITAVKEKISAKTKAVTMVHFGGGISAEIDQLVDLCKTKNLLLIEDCAHAVGAIWKNKAAGTIGDVGCFSFYPTKIITSGEGGMLVTNREDIAAFARSMQHRGRDFSQQKEVYSLPGRNVRMPEVSALLGRVQLRRLEQNLKRRREIAAQYTAAFAKLPKTQIPAAGEDCRPSYWKYPILIPGNKRDQVLAILQEKQIFADKTYDPPVHLQPFFMTHYHTYAGMLPQTEALLSRHICLPCHNRMTTEDADYVIQIFTEALRSVQ